MRVYPVIDFLETEICFLAEVDIKGTIYKFSSFPIELDNNGGGQTFYEGRLSDPDFRQELLEIGQIKLSSNSMSMGLVFPFNVAGKQMLGVGIDNALVTMYFVTIKRGRPEQTYEERIAFFRGVIREPVYGHPNADEGYVEFSIENEIYVNDTSMLRALNGDLTLFDNFQYSREFFLGGGPIEDVVNTDGLMLANDYHQGKTVPAVIGSPGKTDRIDGTAVDYAATPGYVAAVDFFVGPNPNVFLIIAGHTVDAPTVTVQDNRGNKLTGKTVYNGVGQKGEIFAYVFFNNTVIDFDPNNNSVQYFVRWVDGGGSISPFSGGALERGGDLITWALESLRIDYDKEAFAAVRPVLNEYVFAGYINDISIKTYEFLQKYVIPFLPVTLSTGARGIYPVIDHRNTELFLNPRAIITADALFERITPVTPRDSEIVNDLVVQYASGFAQTVQLNSWGYGASVEGNEYKGIIQIRAERLEGVNAPYEIVSPYCIISQQRYGVQSSSIALDYVHDRETAIKIGLDYVRRKSLPEKVCTYRAAFSYGYLMIGDVIELTDLDISLSSSTVQIVGKQYDGASWLYDIMYQENPIDNIRVTQ